MLFEELTGFHMSGSWNENEHDAFIDVEKIKEEVQDSSDSESIQCVEDEDRYSVSSSGHFCSSLEFVEVKHELPDTDGSEERPNDGVWSETSSEVPVELLQMKQKFPDRGTNKEVHNEGHYSTTSRRPQRTASKNVLRIVKEIVRDEAQSSSHDKAHNSYRDEAHSSFHDVKYRTYRDKNNEASRKSRQQKRRRVAEAEAEVMRLEESLPRLRIRARRLEELVVRWRKFAFAILPPSVATVARAGPSKKC